MRKPLLITGIVGLSALLFASCSQPSESYIIDVVDLPLQSIEEPQGDWEVTPLRVHARYLLDHAESRKEKRARLGDYYFVNWYDAQPASRTELRMSYTQAKTGSKILTRRVVYDQPRTSARKRDAEFFFNGAERAKQGDIHSWCIELYVEGRLVASKQSFLWE